MADQNTIDEVRNAMTIVAKLARDNPVYAPIYESLERDLAELKSSKNIQTRIARTLEIDALC